MSIAIFGGSFDPVHKGHISLARAMTENIADIHRLIVIPAAVSPFKAGNGTTNGLRRLDMCRLAFADISIAEVSDYEIKKGGVSYTSDTLKAFKEKYPDEKIYLILGSDSLKTLPNWHEFPIIMKLCTPAAAARSEKDIKALEEYAEKVREYGTVLIIRVSPFEISSTEIRRKIAAGEDISPYVPEKAARYIAENNLYK